MLRSNSIHEEVYSIPINAWFVTLTVGVGLVLSVETIQYKFAINVPFKSSPWFVVLTVGFIELLWSVESYQKCFLNSNEYVDPIHKCIGITV